MPILDPGDPEFMGFDVSREFTSALHDETIIQGGTVSKFYRDLVEGTAVDQQWKNFAEMARIALATLAMTRGLPQDRLGALETVYREAAKVVVAELREVILDKAIEGALLAFDEALNMVASRVPIVGWIVRLGLFVYDLIRTAVIEAEVDPATAEGRAIAYDKGADQDIVRAMLGVLKGDDWTELFLPQQSPDRVAVKQIAYTVRGTADGWAWEVEGERLGWGLTPGLSTRWTGCVGYYQSPRRTPGSSRDAGITSVTAFGVMHPSVMQFGLATWQMVIKNSPDAFRIDGNRIISAWHDQYDLLTEYAQEMPNSEKWLRSQMIQGCQWWDTQYSESRVEGYKPEALPDQYVGNKYERWYSSLIEYNVQKKWRGRLDAYLETLTVAYVPPDAIALRNDSGLAQKHLAMRALLLKHKARYDVELALIPDEAYRSAMSDVQRTIDPWFVANPPRQVYGALDFVAPIDPEMPPAPIPDADPAPGMDPYTPPEKSNKAGSGAAILLILLAGAAVIRTKRR